MWPLTWDSREWTSVHIFLAWQLEADRSISNSLIPAEEWVEEELRGSLNPLKPAVEELVEKVDFFYLISVIFLTKHVKPTLLHFF